MPRQQPLALPRRREVNATRRQQDSVSAALFKPLVLLVNFVLSRLGLYLLLHFSPVQLTVSLVAHSATIEVFKVTQFQYTTESIRRQSLRQRFHLGNFKYMCYFDQDNFTVQYYRNNFSKKIKTTIRNRLIL